MNVPTAARKITIVRIIGRLNIGGPAIHVTNLNAGLNSQRYRSQLVCGTEGAEEGSMLDYALKRGVQPIVIAEIVTDFKLRPRDLKALFKIYRLLRGERPLIVHTHTAKVSFLGRLAARTARMPVVVHTYHGHVLQGYYNPFKS